MLASANLHIAHAFVRDFLISGRKLHRILLYRPLAISHSVNVNAAVSQSSMQDLVCGLNLQAGH
jgi:hypothetical protein